MKVSVIIATYNRAQYIEKAIGSVLCQSYKNVEIIVVDDGSTDNTKRILNPYIEDGEIKYIYQKNAGSVRARDVGIKHSQGKYIAILDSDDIWCNQDKLKKQVEFLEKNPKDAWELVGGYCSEGPDFANDWSLWLKLGKVGKLYNFQEYFVRYLEGGQNSSYRSIRQTSKLDIKLRKKYRNDYPNFWKAFILSWISYFYSLFPIISKLKRLIYENTNY